jgi:cytochrome P450
MPRPSQSARDSSSDGTGAVRSLALDLWDDHSAQVTQSWFPRWAPVVGTRAAAWGPDEHIRSIKGYLNSRRVLHHPELESLIGNGNLRQSDSNLLFLDGEVHDRLRAIINRVLPDWRSAAAASTRFIENLMTGLPDRGQVDLVNDFAVPIAEDMTYFILGLHRREEDRLAWKLATMSAQFDPSFGPAHQARAIDAGRELLTLVRLAIRDRSYEPGSALGLLDEARRSGELSVREQLASSVMLAHASFQNSVNLLSFAAAEAMTNSALAETMAGDDQAGQRKCVEELLRLGSPVRFLIRRASTGLTVGDTAIDEGDLVAPFVGEANRDPSVFDHADEFDGSRVGAAHLAFGSGAHACLGATIARAETLVAVRCLVGKYRTFALTSVTWGSNAVMFGPTSLVAELGP